MNDKPLILLAAAAAAALLAQPVRAETTATAMLANFRITLVDLDTTDGIAPAISFAGRASSYVLVVDTAIGQVASAKEVASSAFNLLPITRSNDGSAATIDGTTASFTQATFSAPDTLVGDMTTTSSSRGTAGPASEAHYGAYGSDASWNAPDLAGGFTLSARTQVVFSADAHVAVALSTGFRSVAGVSSGNYESARAAAGFRVGGAGGGSPPGSELILDLDNRQNLDPVSGEFLPLSASQSAPLSVVFTNDGAQALAIPDFEAYLETDGASFAVTAVPEPEAYALLLGGLGAIGFVVQRRRPL